MKTLFEFQVVALDDFIVHLQAFRDLKSGRKMVVLDAPTGSGKTLITYSAIYQELRKSPKHRSFDVVLILTPSQDTRNGYSMGKVAFPQKGNTVRDVMDGRNLTYNAGKARDKWAREIFNHLAHPRCDTMDRSVLVACHAAGVLFFKTEDLQAIDWARVLVVIDEAHHVSADYEESVKEDLDSAETGLGMLCREVLKLGATVLLTTATAFRSDSTQRVYPADAEIVKVSYRDYVEQLGAPSQLNINLVGPGDDLGFKDLEATTPNRLAGDYQAGEGEISEGDALRLALKIVKDGRDADGKLRSKSFIKIPRVYRTLEDGTKATTKTVERITAALEQEWPGVRIVDGTGNNEKVFLEKLSSEKKAKTYAESEVDVFFVCGRGKEGTDWKFCSHVYHIGLISSLPYLIQILGRSTRSKAVDLIPDYPDFLRDQASLTMFVPNIGEKLSANLRSRWHSGVCLAACFIQSQEVARDFMDVVSRRIRLRCGKKGAPKTKLARLVSLLNKVCPRPDETAMAGRFIGSFEEDFMHRHGRAPNVSEVLEALTEDSTLPPRVKTAGVLLQVATLVEGAEEDEGVLDIVDAFVDTVLETPDPDDAGPSGGRSGLEVSGEIDVYSEYLKEAFQKLAEDKWGKITPKPMLDGQLEVASKIWGQDLPDLARDFSALRHRYPHYLDAAIVVEDWYRKRGPCGRMISGDLTEEFGRPYSAATLRKDLKNGRLVEQPEHVRSLEDLMRQQWITI